MSNFPNTRRRFPGDVPKLVGRVWNDITRQLEDYLRKLVDVVSEGIPPGFKNVNAVPVVVDNSGTTGTPGNESDGWAAATHGHTVKRDVRVYQDGVEKATRNALNFLGGAVGDEGSVLDRISVDLTSGQATIAAILKDIRSFWAFDELGGLRYISAGTNANTLTPNGTIIVSTPTSLDQGSLIGRSVQRASGSNAYLEAADHASLRLNSDFTIWGWFAPSYTTGDTSICLHKGTPGVAASLEYALDFGTVSVNKATISISDGATIVSVSSQLNFLIGGGLHSFVCAWLDSAAQTLNIQVGNFFFGLQPVVSVPVTILPQAGTSVFRIFSNSGAYALSADAVGIHGRKPTKGEREFLFNGGFGIQLERNPAVQPGGGQRPGEIVDWYAEDAMAAGV